MRAAIVTEAGTKLAYPTRSIADDGAQEKGSTAATPPQAPGKT